MLNSLSIFKHVFIGVTVVYTVMVYNAAVISIVSVWESNGYKKMYWLSRLIKI